MANPTSTSAMVRNEAPSRSRFLELPGEIHELIYTNVFRTIDNKYDSGGGHQHYKIDLNLLLVNQQVYYEARRIFRQQNIFVAIETPWPEAQEHVRKEGYVPILITDEQAARFENQHLSVIIDAPRYQFHVQKPRKFIILLDDLPVFTEMWFYSDLSHPGLNTGLRLSLKLRNPYALPFESSPIPKTLQRQLLLPFGAVKGLLEVNVQGDHYDVLAKTMKDTMATPYSPAETCLEDANALKELGNQALATENFTQAIKHYEQAFLAIHIVCSGRTRSIWADEYFNRMLQSGTYKDQHGQLVRMVLRIRLVANIIHAYLQLHDHEEAKFWGMRSIELMAGAFEPAPGEEAVNLEADAMRAQPDFIAAPEMGKIYYRTGMACKALGEFPLARKLLTVACKYRPQDRIVKSEWEALDPSLTR